MTEPYDYSPACWGWALPTEADWEAIRESVGGQYGSAAEFLLDDPSFMMRQWQRNRCAVCGRLDDRLVEDHDHKTALVRGWLCRSCNTREGMNRSTGYRVWREYRERNPASMLGIKVRYWNPLLNAYAEPDSPEWSDTERWARNPMQGVL